jgi:hypothetical protein
MNTSDSYRPDLPPMPDRIARLPVHRGYPVPWFCIWRDGTPDFRIIDTAKFKPAILEKRCWICGQKLGAFLAFAIGPMCAINRVTGEPPSHRACTEWAMTACPFLTQRQTKRRMNDLPETYKEPAGIGLTRQPGVALLWMTKHYRVMHIEESEGTNGGLLFMVGEPLDVAWYRDGRPATRAEVVESIESGYPFLLEAAQEDGPKAVKLLESYRDRAWRLLPSEVQP